MPDKLDKEIEANNAQVQLILTLDQLAQLLVWINENPVEGALFKNVSVTRIT